MPENPTSSNSPPAPHHPSHFPGHSRPVRPWPTWRKVLAYLLLTTLALASIWFIDRQATRPPGAPPGALPESTDRPANR